MGLVEVVRPITASDETIDGGRSSSPEGCGKEPVDVEDRAGFVVNALLFPYLNNAVRLLERGVASKEDIDAAMVGGCGFPMGPFALLDLVGLDTSVAILDALYAERGEPQCAPAPMLQADGGRRPPRPEVGPGLLRVPAPLSGPTAGDRAPVGGNRGSGHRNRREGGDVSEDQAARPRASRG